jgi:uncharacterized membrane protein
MSYGLTSFSEGVNSTGKIIKTSPTIVQVLIDIALKASIAFGIAFILYTKIKSSNPVTKYSSFIIAALFTFWTASSYSKGQWEDKVVTFLFFIFTTGIYYFTIMFFDYGLGLSTDNPIVSGVLVLITFFALIIAVSRYRYLNVVEAAGWAIGFSVVGLFAFTQSIWGTLKVCQQVQTQGGIADPLYITIPIYLLWGILNGMLFFAHTGKIKTDTKFTIIGVAIAMAAGLLWYSWKRCAATAEKIKTVSEEEGEKIAITQEVSWINTGAYIAMVSAWFNLFIGHNFSSLFFSVLGFAILDQCAPKGDIRTLGLTSAVFVNAIYYFFKGAIST